MTVYISDQAEEFRIEISGRFADTVVGDTARAWKTALHANTPRRISVDITRMTGYDREGYLLLREVHVHGTHIVAGTPRSLLFFHQISTTARASSNSNEGKLRPEKRGADKETMALAHRAAASGE